MNQLNPKLSTAPAHAEIQGNQAACEATGVQSRRVWLNQAGTLAGLAIAASLGRRAFAQGTGTTPGPTAGPMGPPPQVWDNAGAPVYSTAIPGADQAQEANGIVPDQDHNPNNPANTIPGSIAHATSGDLDILNFALLLEYLEADFYARVVQAHQTVPYLRDHEFRAAEKIAADEAAHVAALLQIITGAKGTPVPKPTFSFPTEVFSAPFGFLNLASTLEATGTGAYLGAVPSVKSKDVLKFAASIYGIETRHAALIRLLSGADFAPTELEIALEQDEVLQRVRPFIAST